MDVNSVSHARSASYNSDFSDEFPIPKSSMGMKEIAIAVCKIASLIIFTSLAVIGWLLVGSGAIASFGLLPAALIAVGTVVATILTIAAVHFANKEPPGSLLDYADESPLEGENSEAVPGQSLPGIDSPFSSESDVDYSSGSDED